MPLVRVQLSTPAQDEQALMKALSSAVAGALGKPEAYMMVVLEPPARLLMGGSEGPAALVEVRSVGSISGAQAAALSAKICELITKHAAVPGERTYLNFAGVPGAMWGHDGATFG
jgi:phenylpyruvate tautomerase PptA (4-oxalocrotonate tautomerase family)